MVEADGRSGPDGEPWSGEELEDLRSELLEWYDRHRRDLPWRGIDDPYRTWVAEMMLQQTRVATVVDYYERWMERFPDVESVAEAEVDDVLEIWEGLGYYRRARYVHESAGRIVEEYGGELPGDPEELEELPGIGPYTAGAIASIAFERCTPVVDGNVSRVLSRLHAIEGDPTDRSNKEAYWALAEGMVDPARPGDFNQAMMELGATVCTPREPSCLLCPVRGHCRAFEEGQPEAYPDRASRATQRPVDLATCAVVARSAEGERSTYVVKREADGLLGGLWEFPTVELDGEESVGTALDGVFGGSLELPEARGVDGREVGEVTHLLSHLRLSIDVRLRRLESVEPNLGAPGDVADRGAGWLAVDELDAVPMSTAMRRVQCAVFEAEVDKS